MDKDNLRNPCLACDLLNECKKNPVCLACIKRVEYDAAMGGAAFSLPDNVSMDGDGGYNVEDFISYRAPDTISPGGGQDTMSKKEEVEILIKSICEDNLVTPEAVRTGGRASPVTAARHAIIEALSAPEFDVPQADIAKLVGVTYAAVNLVAKNQKKAAKSGGAQGVEEVEKPFSGSVLIVTLDFTGLEDLYEWLDRGAREQLRTRENLALFILKERFEAQ